MNKSRLASLTLHASIVALVLLCGSVIHPVAERQRHAERLTFIAPARDLPIPIVSPSSAVSAQGKVARLAVDSAPFTLRITSPAEERPVLLATLSNSESTVELPEARTPRVTLAQQIAVGAFGNTAGVASGHPGGTTVQAGFGAATGSQGTQRSGGGRVVMAGFSANPRSELPAVATRTPVVQPASVQFIPRAYYSPEARSVGITGQVVLRLRLRSDRKVDVLEVVQGLGYGVPVDSVHTLTVDFELSN